MTTTTRFIPAYTGNGRGARRNHRPRTVYPRVYGERLNTGVISQLLNGLSPRIRGTVPVRRRTGRPGRFIPAYTGNGGPLLLAYSPNAVYPRVYGERTAARASRCASAGLSPRIRGTAKPIIQTLYCRRFIPAYTGNGNRARKRSTSTAVYPRVYGERSPWALMASVMVGLSPRIRGTGRSCPGTCDQSAVYPRVYGERNTNRHRADFQCGLSPRIRGTAFRGFNSASRNRFIPAYTGNGIALRFRIANSAVYPRVYGERQLLGITLENRSGLSPRIRGTDQQAGRRCADLRFIPAYTGNGTNRVIGSASSAVYPRVYGERRVSRFGCSSAIGLSPRIRGTVD